jgi:hypothetical protein
MPNKVDSWSLIVSRDAQSPLMSPDRLWVLQSLLQQVLGALLLHETYHLPAASAKTKSGCSLEDSSLWDDIT